MKRIREYLPTVISGIFFVLPFAVFAVNQDTLQDVLIMNSLSGNGMLYALIGLLLIFGVYLAYRAIYTPKNQRTYVWASTISSLVYLLFMIIFTIGLIGLTTGFMTSTLTSTGALVTIVTIYPMALLFLDRDWGVYNIKKNLPITEAFDISVKRSSTVAGIYTIVMILATFTASVIINDWTSFLISIALLTVWNSIFYVLIRPHVIGRLISWKFREK